MFTMPTNVSSLRAKPMFKVGSFMVIPYKARLSGPFFQAIAGEEVEDHVVTFLKPGKKSPAKSFLVP